MTVTSILMLLRPFYFSGLLYSKYLPNTSSKEPTYMTLDTMNNMRTIDKSRRTTHGTWNIN